MIIGKKLQEIGNHLGLIAICMILLIAFVDQFMQTALPCPLCLLQRAAFICVGLGLCLNIKHGIVINHYGLIILSALLGFAIALRQIFLHALPGDPGYGSVIFHLHYYSWAAVIFFLIIGFCAVALLLPKGFNFTHTGPYHPNSSYSNVLILFFLGLILANFISTILECGFKICPGNPVNYYLLTDDTAFRHVVLASANLVAN